MPQIKATAPIKPLQEIVNALFVSILYTESVTGRGIPLRSSCLKVHIALALEEIYIEQSRLEGNTPDGAQELAMAELLQGLHFSKYNTIIEVLWNEFANEVEPGNASALALKLLPTLEEPFSQYTLSDDFAQLPDSDLLYTELTGAVAIYLEEYGV